MEPLLDTGKEEMGQKVTVRTNDLWSELGPKSSSESWGKAKLRVQVDRKGKWKLQLRSLFKTLTEKLKCLQQSTEKSRPAQVDELLQAQDCAQTND